jgi:hypothetical protein
MYVIRARFAFAEQHPMAYWWPLLCEAMRCQGLAYDNPYYLPERLGDYFFFHTSGDMEEKNRQSFRQMWDDLHDQQCRGIHTSFSSYTTPDLWVEGRISQEPETQAITFSCELTFLGESQELTPEAATAEAARRVHQWLTILREIVRLCGPCTAELTHERYGVVSRIGTIGKPLVLEWWTSPTKYGVYEGEIVQERLPDGSVLSVVTPLRLPWRGDAIPITLHSEDQSQEPNHSGPK